MAWPAPAAAGPRACGIVSAETGQYRFRVDAIRGVTCRQARRVARRHDWGQRAPAGWRCFLARRSDAPRLFSCGAGGTAGDVRSWPRALEAISTPGRAPRTRIRKLRLRRDSRRSFIRLRVCGAPGGRLRLRISETMSAPGRSRPVFSSRRRGLIRRQARRCQTHRASWPTHDSFFGVGRYRVAVRARTSGRRWSGVAARRLDTFD